MATSQGKTAIRNNRSDGQKHDGQNEPKEQPKPPLKERVRVYLRTQQKQVAIGAVGFVVLCIAGILLLLYLRSYESTDDAQVDGHLNAGVVAAQAAADAAQKAIEQRRAQLAQVQARLNESKQNAPRNVAIRQAREEARQAAVLTVRSRLEQATLNFSYTKISAPAAGIVTSKSVEVGERVEPGQQLLIVSQTQYIWITANFKETQLKKNASWPAGRCPRRCLFQEIPRIRREHARRHRCAHQPACS
jgi:multidrug resistance efflux pump